MAIKKTKYVQKIIQTRTFSKTTEKTIQITRNNKHKEMDVDEMHNILTGLQTRLGSDAKIMVRGMNAQRFFTFKGFNDEELNVDDFDEYYKNKVEDEEKFAMFSMIQITVLQPNNLKIKK